MPVANAAHLEREQRNSCDGATADGHRSHSPLLNASQDDAMDEVTNAGTEIGRGHAVPANDDHDAAGLAEQGSDVVIDPTLVVSSDSE
eukprot:1762831-Amphidinium_carterae.2